MSTPHMSASRRVFLRQAAQLSAFTGSAFALNLLGIGAASAQSVGDYKALVCIFLAGGNDQANTVVPRSGSAYTGYQQARPSLALPAASLRAINPSQYSGPELGLHPSLSALQPLFNQQRIALVANVGTLTQPITQAQWNNGQPTVPVPHQLFSHSDQQGQWQTGLPDRTSQTGWKGRMGDLLASTHNPNSQVSIAMSVAGNNLMQAGASTIQYQLTTDGAVPVHGPLPFSSQGLTAMRQLMSQSRDHLLERELNRVGARAINTEGVVTSALAGVSLATVFPNTGIGRQLRLVARMIAARSALGQRRQMFFVQHGGYDFHDNLLTDQAARLQEVGDAMGAFYQATEALGVANQVTSFTASDFGRALQHNGRGSDHGWGGHHFVMGGSVQGNRVFGQFPSTRLGGPEDSGRGSAIPTTSVDEYAGTLARWFGVSPTDLPLVLPNIGRFASSNMGFMGAL
jgi:uncharacterized protein (DUF1501 family)